MNVCRRNWFAFACITAVLAAGWMVRFFLHLRAFRYSAACLIVCALIVGAVAAAALAIFRIFDLRLHRILTVVLCVAALSPALYRISRDDAPRRMVVQVAGLIRSSVRHGDEVVVTYGRKYQFANLLRGIGVYQDPILDDPGADAVGSVVRRWKYHDLFMVVRYGSRSRRDDVIGPGAKCLGRIPERKRTVEVYFQPAAVPGTLAAMPEGSERSPILNEMWSDTVTVSPKSIHHGILKTRGLAFAASGVEVKMPRRWSLMTINGFWDAGSDGDLRVLPATDLPGRNILRLSADKPIRICSPWVEYRKGDRFQLDLIARGGGGRNADLTVALQDFIAPGAYQPVHEVLHLPLKTGDFRFYTTEFDCAELAGGKKFNLTLDLQSGTGEVLFISLKKI